MSDLPDDWLARRLGLNEPAEGSQSEDPLRLAPLATPEVTRLNPITYRYKLKALTVDPIREIVVFENFPFRTSFFPQKQPRRREIPFAEILEANYEEDGIKFQNETHDVVWIQTSAGPTLIDDQMEGFASAREVLEAIVSHNKWDTPVQYAANLQKIPKIHVPWYGWLVVLLMFSGLFAFIRWMWFLIK
jgi:hypothetical protein